MDQGLMAAKVKLEDMFIPIVLMQPTRLDGVDDQLNTERLRTHERFFGPAGFGAPDDVEMFVNGATGMKARGVEWAILSRGLHRETRGDGVWLGGHSTDEAPQRSAYREWRRWMAGTGRVARPGEA